MAERTVSELSWDFRSKASMEEDVEAGVREPKRGAQLCRWGKLLLTTVKAFW